MALLRTPDGVLWAGSTRGLSRLLPGGALTRVDVPGLPAQLRERPGGGPRGGLLVGVAESGLFEVDPVVLDGAPRWERRRAGEERLRPRPRGGRRRHLDRHERPGGVPLGRRLVVRAVRDGGGASGREGLGRLRGPGGNPLVRYGLRARQARTGRVPDVRAGRRAPRGVAALQHGRDAGRRPLDRRARPGTRPAQRGRRRPGLHREGRPAAHRGPLVLRVALRRRDRGDLARAGTDLGRPGEPVSPAGGSPEDDRRHRLLEGRRAPPRLGAPGALRPPGGKAVAGREARRGLGVGPPRRVRRNRLGRGPRVGRRRPEGRFAAAGARDGRWPSLERRDGDLSGPARRALGRHRPRALLADARPPDPRLRFALGSARFVHLLGRRGPRGVRLGRNEPGRGPDRPVGRGPGLHDERRPRLERVQRGRLLRRQPGACLDHDGRLVPVPGDPGAPTTGASSRRRLGDPPGQGTPHSRRGTFSCRSATRR